MGVPQVSRALPPYAVDVAITVGVPDSRPFAPHPLFADFVRAAMVQSRLV